MPKDKKETKGIVLSIKCKQGHISPYQPKDPDNIPSRIRCPHSIGGRPCKAACEVIDTDPDKDPVELPTPKTTKIETPDPEQEPEVPKPAPEPKEKKVRGERKSYDMKFHTDDITDKDTERLLEEIDSYATSLKIKRRCTSNLVIYHVDKAVLFQVVPNKRSLKIRFNADKPIKHEKIVDISGTTRGNNFNCQGMKLRYDDVLIVKSMIDKTIEKSKTN